MQHLLLFEWQVIYGKMSMKDGLIYLFIDIIYNSCDHDTIIWRVNRPEILLVNHSTITPLSPTYLLNITAEITFKHLLGISGAF